MRLTPKRTHRKYYLLALPLFPLVGATFIAYEALFGVSAGEVFFVVAFVLTLAAITEFAFVAVDAIQKYDTSRAKQSSENWRTSHREQD